MPHVPDTVPGKRVPGAGARTEGRGQPSNIRGGSRMQESCTYGTVRGAPSNGRPYRHRQMGNAFTGAAPSSGASRAMRKVAQPCRAASARIGATLPQCQAARIVIRRPFNPAPHPQHHRWLALSNGLAHDQNPAAAGGTRTASSASVRAEKRAVDRRVLVDDDWRCVGQWAPLQQPVRAGRLLLDTKTMATTSAIRYAVCTQLNRPSAMPRPA